MIMKFFSLVMAFMLSGVYAFATESATNPIDKGVTAANEDGENDAFHNEIDSMIADEIFSESDRLYADISNTDNQEISNNEQENENNYSMNISENDTLAELNNRDPASEETGEDAASQEDVAPQPEASEQPTTETPVMAKSRPSRWSFYTEFWNEGKLSFDEGFETYITIRPQYQLTDKLSVRFSFESMVKWSVPGEKTKEIKWSPGDSYLMFNLSTVSLGAFDMFGYMRIYLPFSEQSVEIGQIAHVRIKPYFTLPLSRNLRLAIRPEIRYFQHSVDSVRKKGAFAGNNNIPQCQSAQQYCSDNNTWWRVEPLVGLMGKVYGPFSFESIHGFRVVRHFNNPTADVAGTTSEKKYEFLWYNESGIIWDVANTPITLAFGFYDLRKTGGPFWKRLPIVSYFTGPHNESFWWFSIWGSI